MSSLVLPDLDGLQGASPDELCAHHNRCKHRHHYHTWRDPQAIWHLTKPDGTKIGSHPNAPPQPTTGN